MSKLREIFEHKRLEVLQARASSPLDELRARAKDAPLTRGFRKALGDRHRPVGLIAEVKKASPSRGLIRANFDPVDVAQAYERAGAHCLSVLTDERYFQGSPHNLIKARLATNLPVLRKDFLCDVYQVYEARVWGADAILLIVAGLEVSELKPLYSVARELGMDVLVEVHDEHEAEMALAIGADLIGVNNRNLATFETCLQASDRLLPMLKGHALAVSESAIETHEDVERVRTAGADAVLIGSTFCAAPDVEAKVREVMGW